MERLTQRHDEFDEIGILNPNDPEGFYEITDLDTEEDKELLLNVAERLAQYEDLEEAERLVILPCKIGTEIHFIQYCQAPSCKECGCNNKHGDCYMDKKARIRHDKFSLYYLSAFGRSVFFTHKEAEDALNITT